MSDHNQDNKRDTRTKLLGELESIKALLDEDEWGEIPILKDAVTDGAAPSTAPAPEHLPPAEHRPHSDIEAAVDRLNFDLDLSEEDALSERDESHEFHDSGENDWPESEELPTLTDAVTANPATEEAAQLAHSELPPLPDQPEWPAADVLPGQQSLFEPAPKPDETAIDRGDETEAAPVSAPPAASDSAGDTPGPSEPTAVQPATRPSQRPLKRGTGENPFLPKHIRERLHTHKTLVDIIKETPLPFPKSARSLTEQLHQQVREQLPHEVPPERLQALVDEVLALYLPRIEAELRQRLLAELKPAEPPTDT